MRLTVSSPRCGHQGAAVVQGPSARQAIGAFTRDCFIASPGSR